LLSTVSDASAAPGAWLATSAARRATADAPRCPILSSVSAAPLPPSDVGPVSAMRTVAPPPDGSISVSSSRDDSSVVPPSPTRIPGRAS